MYFLVSFPFARLFLFFFLLLPPLAFGKNHRTSSLAIGSYTRGCIQNAEKLNPEGLGYQTVRFSRQRLFGHPSLLQFIEKLAQKAQTLWKEEEENSPNHFVLGIGDLSSPLGGPAFDNHRSHQNGLEADILYTPISLSASRAERENLLWPSVVDKEKKQTNEKFTRKQALLLYEAAQLPEVDRIFVNVAIVRSLCETSWFPKESLRKIRPWYGHDDHFHVRLKCPKDSSHVCHSQPSLPSTKELCGETLQAWLFPPPSDPKKPQPKRPATPYEPDPRCKTIFASSSLMDVSKNAQALRKKSRQTTFAQNSRVGKKSLRKRTHS